jgi:hypothetical protein
MCPRRQLHDTLTECRLRGYERPKPYQRGCVDADLHGGGLCSTCGGSFYG